MAEKDENTLQLMYRYERLVAPNGYEYVVRGAKVFCDWGDPGNFCVLNLPVDHGKCTPDNRPLITHKDCKYENVSGFGICHRTGQDIICKPVLDEWTHSTAKSEIIVNGDTYEREYAVTRDATATCTARGKAATVKIVTSGQVVPDYSDKKLEGSVEIIEDVKGYWKREEGGEERDFLGHIRVDHLGVYCLGINLQKKATFNGGSIFLYSNYGIVKKILSYLQAYELKEHPNEKLEGFKDIEYIIHTYNDNTPSDVEQKTFYWTIWATLMFQKNTDYYVEIDCPNIDSYDYKLIALEYVEIEKITNILNDLMCNINRLMVEGDSIVKKIYQALDDAIKLKSVFAIGISCSAGANAYLSAAAQLVVDLHGNIGLQITLGTGIEAGVSADGTLYIAWYPGVEDITGVEGFGVEIGGSIGEAFIGSISALCAGEGDDLELAGVMLGAGLGVEGTVGEGHISMGGTFPTIRLGNIVTNQWDTIFNNWSIVYTMWIRLYSQVN